jgi:serine/threonine-protein kinase
LLREGPLAEANVVAILEGLLSALAYAHALSNPRTGQLGVIHRDVSPSNVFVGIDGRVKLLDFGLARARTQFGKTDPAFIKAKLGYLAPEQVTGVIDHRVDLFALGVCAFEALTGKNPFARSSASGALHAFDAYTSPPAVRAESPAVSEELAAIVERLLAPKPEDRYANAGAALDALRATCTRAPQADLARMVATLFPDLRSTPPPEGRSSRPDPKRQLLEEVEGTPARSGTTPIFLILLVSAGLVLAALVAWAIFS